MEQSIPNESPHKGKPTVESFIAVCECGSVSYTVKKKTATSVSLECTKCGVITSIKGNIAPIRVQEGEVLYAVQENIVRPDPAAGAGGKKKGDKKTLGEQGYRTLRFKVSNADYDKIIRRGLDAARVQNLGTDAFREKQWQGTTLVYIIADFLAGVDHRALEVVDAVEAAVQAKIVEYKKVKKKELPVNQQCKIRADVREQLAKELGFWDEPKYEGEKKTAQEKKSKEEYEQSTQKKKDEEAADQRIPDRGRMYKNMTDGLAECISEFTDEGPPSLSYIAVQADQYVDVVKKHRETPGGVLMQLDGDPQLKDNTGRRPRMFLWVSDPQRIPDLGEMYGDIYEDTFDKPRLSITEMILPGHESHGITTETIKIEV